jgi:hypothetical protein
MHLNALYRAAEAGKQSLTDCVLSLSSASKWAGRDRSRIDPRGVIGMPLKFWHLRQARQHLDEAKRHLKVVRENVSLVAALGQHTQIDSSGGYAVADLLAGGLLETLVDIEVENRIETTLLEVNGLLSQVGELMLRMRKAGAVS